MAANAQPKIFKKYEIVEGGGHHGGGWKVAYADFMTAMMAFFLLMWILASSDEQKLRGIAEYFTNASMPGGSGVLDGATLGPPGTLTASNGSVVARGSELGKVDDPSPAKWEVRDVTPTSDPKEKTLGSEEGDHENPAAADVSQVKADVKPDAENTNAPAAAAETDVEAEHPIDDMKFQQLQEEILQAMQDNPELDAFEQNVIFEQTPEGLHIQIIDQEGQPMFRSGRAEMVGGTEDLLSSLGQSLAKIPNRIVLAGHTDAVPFSNTANYDNWDLSTDRANATRRVFENTGVSRDRVIRVSGMADTQLLVPEKPKDPSNRRISILVQYRTAQDEPKPEREAMAKPEMTSPPSPAVETPQASQEPQEPIQEVKLEMKNPSPPTLDDQVFQDLRNALR